MAAALSEVELTPRPNSTLGITADKEFLGLLLKGYKEDSWTKSLPFATPSMTNLRNQDGLWFLDERLIVPNYVLCLVFRHPVPRDHLDHMTLPITLCFTSQLYG